MTLDEIECLQILKGHKGGVSSVAFSPVGRLLASGEDDGTIRLWNPDTGECLKILKEKLLFMGPVRAKVAYSTCGKKLVSSLEYYKGIKVWNLNVDLNDPATEVECLRELEGHESGICMVVCSPQGSSQFVSVSKDKTIKIWDANTHDHLKTLVTNAPVHSAAFSPNGIYFASGDDRGTIKIWDSASGECLQTVDKHPDIFGNIIRAIECSPDGKQLASGGDDGKVRIWDLNINLEDPEAKIECLLTLEGQQGKIYTVAYSPVISKEALSQEQMPRKSFEQKLLEYASESLKSSGDEKYDLAVKLFACSLFKSLKNAEQAKLWRSVSQ